MTPKFITKKKTDRAEKIREVRYDFMECRTEKEINAMVVIHADAIRKYGLKDVVSAAIKRVKTNKL